MKNLKINLSFIMMMLVCTSALAQSSTVTIRKAYETSYSTAYWITTQPARNYTVNPYVAPTTTTPNTNWMVYLPPEVAGDKNYEAHIRRTVTLFNKANKTPDEYQLLRDYGYTWDVIYKRPKDTRLREFYRHHAHGVLNLGGIFGDKPASITEKF